MRTHERAATIKSVIGKISSLSKEIEGKGIIREYLTNERRSLDIISSVAKIDEDIVKLCDDLIKRAVVLKNSLTL